MQASKQKPRGRPRSFDRTRALERALTLFWRHGYEGVSMAALTRAMRVTPPSLYAAFGSKEDLFVEVVELYVAKHAGFMVRALEEAPTARAGIERMLAEAAQRYARRDQPRGCLVASALLQCAKQHRRAARIVSRRRKLAIEILEARLQRAVASGELPPAEIRGLAAFFAAVVQGMSTQAADGASVTELKRIAATAMAAWPPSPSER